MKVGIFSDTHDNQQHGIDLAWKVFRANGVEVVMHAGDWTMVETVEYVETLAAQDKIKVYGVMGNNDNEIDELLHRQMSPWQWVEISIPEVMEIELDFKRFAIVHGHVGNSLQEVVADSRNHVVVTGHTHDPKVERLPSGILVNPGALAFSGHSHSAADKTVAVYDTGTGEVEILVV